jgi:ferrochelatase
VEAFVDAALTALADLPEHARDGAHLVYVTHSVPETMNERSGPWGGAYVGQHRSVVAEITDRVRQETGRRHPQHLAYCSRSGAPDVPWLEPDVNDHLETLAKAGAPGVVLVPVGFVSDHMEVVWDLDTEALGTANRLSLPTVRASTPGIDPRFVAVVRDLLLERAAAERGEQPVRRAVGSLMPTADLCPSGCCVNPRGPVPAIGGAE